jgi:hypothetical protein
VTLPDKSFETFHDEKVGSLLTYDFKKLQIDYANAAYSRPKGRNRTGRRYSLLIWTRFPSFIHIFSNDTNKEVYECQIQFLMNSGLGLTTRPKIYSLVITLEHLTIHHKNERDLMWNKQRVESHVDYYDFALYLKLKDTQYFKFQLFEISSVSVLKFCSGCSAASKVSLVHFETCESSPLNKQNLGFNSTHKIIQIISEPGLNLSRFGIEFEVRDFEGLQTYENCLSQTIFKNDITLLFGNKLPVINFDGL